MTAVGVVLAAGQGKRFGGPKAPFEIDGQRLVDRAVRVLIDGGCTEVVVVLGAWQGDVPGATIVFNDQWPTGMGSSLRAGLEHAAERSTADRAIVTLVDLPGLTAAAVRRILGAPGPIVVATYDARRGHPVAFDRALWESVALSCSGDSGAREYLADNAESINAVECGDVATGEDLDVRP